MERRRTTMRGLRLVLTFAVGTAACSDRAPTGQVVASVDGDDITKRDLAFEASATGLPPSPAMLAAIVDRKLLAHRARVEHLDQTPDYLTAVRRFREATLATLLVRRAETAIAAPGGTTIADVVQEHGWMFADRSLVMIEQNGANRSIDTATIADRGQAERLIGTPIGGSTNWAGAPALVVARSHVQMTAAEIDGAARTLLSAVSRQAAVRQLSREERRSARIRYQPGFAPK